MDHLDMFRCWEELLWAELKLDIEAPSDQIFHFLFYRTTVLCNAMIVVARNVPLV